MIGESDEEGLVRSIKEEIDLDIEVVEKLGENEYIASHPTNGKVRKHVVYFLAKATYKELKLMKVGGLDDVKWFPMGEVVDLKMYDDITKYTAKALGIITNNK